MKNPIQPRQYDPYSMNVPSGNIHTEQGIDFFNIILRETLTGDFFVTGSLKIGGHNANYAYAPDETNNITDPSNHTYVFGGISNTATGIENCIVGSSSSTIQGNNNVIIGGLNNDVSGDNSVAIGSYINIVRTGAMVLKDGEFSVVEDNGDDTLTISFGNGTFFKHDVFFDDELWITGTNANFFLKGGGSAYLSDNIHIGGSGLVSGNLNVLGTPYHTGSKLQNLQDFRDNSGVMHSTLTGISGFLQDAITHISQSAAFRSGNSETVISGSYLFGEEVYMQSGAVIYGATGEAHNITNNFIDLYYFDTDRGGVMTQYNSHGATEFNIVNGGGTISQEHDATQDEYYAEKGFSVWDGNTMLFGVNMSGYANFNKPVRMDYTPSTATSFGAQGMVCADEDYLYICTGNNLWGRLPLLANAAWS